MTREQVAALLGEMEAIYSNYQIKDRQVTLNMWQRQLDGYPAEAIFAAFDRYVATDTRGFAPAPGQLLEQIRLAGDDSRMTGMEAWDRVLKASRRASYYAAEEFSKLPPDIQRAVGSSAVLKQWAQLDEEGLGPVRANFLKVYENQAKRIREESVLTPRLKSIMGAVSGNLSLEDKEEHNGKSSL